MSRPLSGHEPSTGKEEPRPPKAKGPFSALAFKVMMDQGRKMTYIRIYSGSVKAGDTIYNPGKNVKEKLARLLRMHSNKRERIDEASAGDIVAVMGLKITTTGDTLCSEDHPILLEPIPFNTPVITMAVEPRRVQDQERLMDCPGETRRGRPHLPVPDRRRDRADGYVRHGGAPPGDHRRETQAGVPGGDQPGETPGRLSGDHPEVGGARRDLPEGFGRSAALCIPQDRALPASPGHREPICGPLRKPRPHTRVPDRHPGGH